MYNLVKSQEEKRGLPACMTASQSVLPVFLNCLISQVPPTHLVSSNLSACAFTTEPSRISWWWYCCCCWCGCLFFSDSRGRGVGGTASSFFSIFPSTEAPDPSADLTRTRDRFLVVRSRREGGGDLILGRRWLRLQDRAQKMVGGWGEANNAIIGMGVCLLMVVWWRCGEWWRRKKGTPVQMRGAAGMEAQCCIWL